MLLRAREHGASEAVGASSEVVGASLHPEQWNSAIGAETQAHLPTLPLLLPLPRTWTSEDIKQTSAFYLPPRLPAVSPTGRSSLEGSQLASVGKVICSLLDPHRENEESEGGAEADRKIASTMCDLNTDVSHSAALWLQMFSIWFV